VKLNEQHRNMKVSKGQDVARKTGLWFRQQLDKAIFPLFALAELVKEIPIFHELPFIIGRGGEPGSAPYMNGTKGTDITHRNVTGICDNVTLMETYNNIGKTVKDDVNKVGINLSTISESLSSVERYAIKIKEFVDPFYSARYLESIRKLARTSKLKEY
jgi:hypothetical protein